MSNTQKSNNPKGSRKMSSSWILIIGKLTIWAVIIFAFYMIIYSIFGPFFSYISWLFNIDPMMLILSMVLVSVAFAAILTGKMGMRRRAK